MNISFNLTNSSSSQIQGSRTSQPSSTNNEHRTAAQLQLTWESQCRGKLKQNTTTTLHQSTAQKMNNQKDQHLYPCTKWFASQLSEPWIPSLFIWSTGIIMWLSCMILKVCWSAYRGEVLYCINLWEGWRGMEWSNLKLQCHRRVDGRMNLSIQSFANESFHQCSVC